MASAIGGAIGGFQKISEGKSMEQAGQRGIDGFEWEELKNPYKDLQVSTLGSDLRTEESARVSATAIEAGRSGGTRGIAATVGRTVAQSNQVSREIAANLDEKQKAIDMAAAGDDVNIRNMTEKRQGDELAGYGNMIDVGRDMRHSGYGDLVAVGGAIDSAAMMAATGGFGGEGLLGAVGKGK